MPQAGIFQGQLFRSAGPVTMPEQKQLQICGRQSAKLEDFSLYIIMLCACVNTQTYVSVSVCKVFAWNNILSNYAR